MKVSASTISPDLLTAELQARGLHYLIGSLPAPSSPRLTDDVLLAGLARQEDARLRSALIPLFLSQPSLTRALPRALSQLGPTEQTALKIYYTAAAILQSEFSDTLVAAYPQWRPLPDLYSEELGLRASDDATQRLHQLGSIHARLTGSQVNWPGTYRHAAERLIRRLQLEQRWAA
jgi:hypothetical protein